MTDPDIGDQTNLFDAFPPATYDEWYETAIAALKGEPFDKLTTTTYEGMTLQPLYRREDTESISHQHTMPGVYPYVRGSRAAGYLQEPWQIAQSLQLGTPQAFNEALQSDLERGQTMVNLLLDRPSRLGLDSDSPGVAAVGKHGVSIATVDDIVQALQGASLETTSLLIDSGVSSVAVLAMLAVAAQDLLSNLNLLSGAVLADPMALLAETGTVPGGLDDAFDHLAAATGWTLQHTPNLQTIGVNTSVYHDGGANAVQELAYALASGAAYMRAMTMRGLSASDVATHTRFTFAVGSRFFMEVAKLRAARLLWAQVVQAFGGDAESQKLSLHVRSATYNKTQVDPYTNMLRTTIEGFAGAVGGIDSMDLAQFDHVIGPPDEFSRRVARNQQLILQHEAHLTRVIDPAGGSYFVEMLTDRLARDAWAEFQRIEATGGMASALQQGIPQQAVAEVAAQRAANIAQRKDILIGINRYPHQHNERAVDATDYQALTQERAEAVRVYRASARPHHSLGNLKAGEAVALMDTLIAAFKGRATLGEVMNALRDDEKTLQVEPVRQERGAALFEALRNNADAYTSQHGHAPRVFLANMGPLKQHKARADFAQGFFQVGGFEVLSPPGFDSPQAAAQAALESGACAVVICSTDATYPEIVPPLVQAIKSQQPEAIVMLAGYPQDQIEAHRDAGIDEFIHLRANCYAVNQWLQQQLRVGTN